MQPFQGFPDELFGFLQELARNNNKEWFNENKTRYQNDVVKPVTEFIEAMGERLARISNCFIADPRPHGGSMFRIYRDTRFSKDKRPYKENVGCQFRHFMGKSAHAPGFYLHLEPGHVFYGGGIWKPDNKALTPIREAIATSPETWTGIVDGPRFKGQFGQVDGESLKRPPKGFDPEHPLIGDIKKKSYFAIKEVDSVRVTTPRFIDEVDEAFQAAAPLMEFLTSALGQPFHQ